MVETRKPIHERYEDIIKKKQEKIKVLKQVEHEKAVLRDPDSYFSNHVPKLCKKSREIVANLGRSKTPAPEEYDTTVSKKVN
jgi:hypothetical protein